MKIISETSLDSFDAWSGGLDVLQRLIDGDHCAECEAELEELFPDGMTDTELNDYLWFECQDQHPEWFRDEEEEEEEEEDA